MKVKNRDAGPQAFTHFYTRYMQAHGPMSWRHADLTTLTRNNTYTIDTNTRNNSNKSKKCVLVYKNVMQKYLHII